MTTLLYHEISDEPHDLIKPFGITIKPKVFEMHMKVVSEREDILVTFDDGYRSAVQYAGDVLLKYKLDSIWHVNSGLWYNNELFWLSRLHLLYPNASIEEMKLGSQVGIFLSNEREMAHEANLYATWHELRALNAEIGNHTRMHYNLLFTTHLGLEDDVKGCHQDIQLMVGREPVSFAFPFGEWLLHWTVETVVAVEAMGYKVLFSTDHKEIHGVLPRHIVPFIDTESGFREYLEGICIKQA